MPRTPKQRRRRAARVKLSKQARLATSMIGEALAMATIEACPEQPRTPPPMPEIYIARKRQRPKPWTGGAR